MAGLPDKSLKQLQAEMAPDLSEAQRQVLAIQTTSHKRLDELFSEMRRTGLNDPASTRTMLTEKYGLAEANVDFLLALARQADAEAVDRDKQALSEAFGYRDYGRDLDLLLEDLERPFHAPMRILGLGYIGPAAAFVMDCYYEKGALEPIVQVKSRSAYRSSAAFDELLDHLHKAQRPDLIERLWSSVVRGARAEWLSMGQGPGAEQQLSRALEAYDHAIDWMTRLGRTEAVQRLTQERDTLREQRFEVLAPVSDLRRIDEAVFWDLIEGSRLQAQTTSEQLAVLGEQLRAFSAADIRRFASLYARRMRALYHWNVWALAYAARGGCSDAAFEEFRAWLILQGDPQLIELAARDPAKAAIRVPPDPDLPDGSSIWMIEEAYLRRSGTPLRSPMIDLDKPKGREWSEAAFETTFPQLAGHYAAANAR